MTPSPWKQNEGHKKTHYTTPTGKYSHNDSNAAESSINAKEVNESKEKGNKGSGFTGTVPHNGRKEHSGRQAVMTNANQGTTVGESKDEQNILEKMKPVDWYLTSKESTFAGAYDMRAPRGTLSPRMQK